MVAINPLDVLFWTLRRNERDVVNMYNSLSPIMQLATGGNMLNFGYWDNTTMEPISAQENLCREFGMLADLENARTAVDLGSGLAAPAISWQKNFPNLNLYCINTNFSQLCSSGRHTRIELLNSTSTCLPFPSGMVDRVLALESSQHFRPYVDFVSESRRILNPSGMLVLAIPVVLNDSMASGLGVLKYTWSSEHYYLDWIRDVLISGGFKVTSERLIGRSVYEPLAAYYTQNRDSLRKSILKEYPSIVEKILHHSIQKMKKASKDRIIDYALFKCVLSK